MILGISWCAPAPAPKPALAVVSEIKTPASTAKLSHIIAPIAPPLARIAYATPILPQISPYALAYSAPLGLAAAPSSYSISEHGMKEWVILLASLAVQTLATQVIYETSSSAQSSASSSNQQKWSTYLGQDLMASANTPEQESFHPLSFSAEDQRQEETQQYSPNIQTSQSTVADALESQESVDAVVDNILVSNRHGRNLEGFDEVYSDPDIKNALQLGNDTIARAYIKDKLCNLGLMNCENLEGRRPFYSPHRDIHPHDIIYAQPVTIKPVGRPLPAVAIKRPYGSAKPVPLPPGFGHGPGHSGPGFIGGPPPPFGRPPPSFSGPSYGPTFSKPPSSYPGLYPGFKKPGPIYGSKPIYEASLDTESDYEDKFIDKKQVIVQPSSTVQQHVHHHYHHGDDTKLGAAGISSGPIIGPGPIGNNAFNNYGYGGGNTYTGSLNEFDEDYKKAFKVKLPSASNSLGSASSAINNYADRYPSYEKPKRDSVLGGFNKGSFVNGQQSGKQFQSGLGGLGSSSQFGGSNFAGNNFAGNNFAGISSGNGLGSGFDNGLSSSNYEDCVCVPYDQCATIDQVGRKEDLYLAIDPRSLGKDIEADTVEVVITDGNGTMNVIRVPKGVNETEQAEETQKENLQVDLAKAKSTEEKPSEEAEKRSKRETKRETSDSKAEQAQGRRIVDNLDTSKLNVKPTWGVSFGLPQSAGSYPINPYGGGALVNPYPGYGAGGQGLNLGLVSVNPLVAVQVTKDEYGEKVVKPFVNLHVTPNHGLVNKIGNILSYKKQALLGHHGPYGHYAPHYYPPGPPYHEKPIFIEKPIHHYPSKPHYPSFGGHGYYEKPQHHIHHHNHHGYYEKPHYHHHEPSYSAYDDYDYSDDYSDYPNDYYSRNARTNITAAREPISKARSTLIDNKGTSNKVAFRDRKKRDVKPVVEIPQERQFGRPPVCGPRHVCCRRNQILNSRPKYNQCGVRNTQGINGRIKTPVYVDGDSEFGEYPWQVAILKKDPNESVYVCGGTLISSRHIITAAHCVKTHAGRDLRARLGEWDVNHDVEFYPYIERDIVSVHVHPEFYAGTLYNDIAILKLDHDVDFEKNPHISPACLPDKHDDFTGTRCWTTGWGKDAFGDFGKYQNILKEVDVPVVSNQVCEHQMKRTRLGSSFNLHPGFICAGGEEGKDACKGDGGGPMVCERNGRWQLSGVVSWGIGCGQPGVPGVYARVSYYLDWIRQVLGEY
ncbi:uncharacterized protein [Prorops nasuta]|uniref:uncharacterized protein n=1 Tax=Prorops nasuta TaxID=863751 RepID=UPI0034CD3DBD